jgi:hypothetical protein
VGSYSYHATKKHAVIAAGSSTYAYDANGTETTIDFGGMVETLATAALALRPAAPAA